MGGVAKCLSSRACVAGCKRREVTGLGWSCSLIPASPPKQVKVPISVGWGWKAGCAFEELS